MRVGGSGERVGVGGSGWGGSGWEMMETNKTNLSKYAFMSWCHSDYLSIIFF